MGKVDPQSRPARRHAGEVLCSVQRKLTTRGFVTTPDLLVDHMVDLLFQGRTVEAGQRLLDPGCGTGAFIEGVLRRSAATRSRLPRVTGVEVDKRLAIEAASRFRDNPQVDVVEADFLKAGPPGKYHYAIGNPPYVSILRLDEREKAEFRELYRSATGRFDLYMLFFERAMEVLEPGGRLVFVTPEKFTYVDSAASLRALIGGYDVRTLEFLPEDTFGDLVTYPLVTVVEKRRGGGPTRIVGRDGVERTARLPRGGESWGPLLRGAGPASNNGRTPDVLSAICDRVSCGIATGADRVFVFERADLPADLMQFAWPTVAGRDLDASRDTVSTHSVMLVPYDAAGSLVALDDLGPFGRYLMEPGVSARLLKRTCASRKPWYSFHETPVLSQVLRPKILCKDIAREPAFWIDRTGSTLPRHSTYYLVPTDESMLDALCRYLNGKEARDWLVEHCQRASNGFIRTQSNVLKRLPIPPELVPEMRFRPRHAADAAHPGPGPHVLEMVA